ncbi:MAG: hypothetical protein QM759_00355 [Terricaulis sp.]
MHIVFTLIAEQLWQRVRAVFARAQNAVGDAARIAAIRDPGERARRNIVARIAPLEAMVRKLLVVEATRFAGDARIQINIGLQRGTAPARQIPPHRRALALDMTQPETWPVRFSLATPSDPRAVANDRAPRIRTLWSQAAPTAPAATQRHAPAQQTRTTFRLARRVEALRRVLDDPIPYARRLARVFVRALRRFPEIVRRYAMAPATTGDYDPDDPRLHIECMTRACGADLAFSSG